MLGLTLAQALALLDGRAVVVLETSPPFAPRHYTPIWGEKRVVRMRDAEQGPLELTVALELLREEKSAPNV